MDRKEEIAEALDYVTVEKMFNKNRLSRCIQHLVTYRTEMMEPEEMGLEENGLSEGEKIRSDRKEKRIINETVEDLRSNLILEIIKREAKEEKVRNIYGFGRTYIHRRIIDIIESDRRAKQNLQKLRELEGLYDTTRKDVEVKIQQREIIMEALNSLEVDEKKIITSYFLYGKTVGEIAEELGIKARVISQIKHRALIIMRNALREKYGEEIEDIMTTLHDISMQEENSKKPTGVIKPTKGIGPFPGPRTDEEKEKMDSEYMNMILHTLYEVAKIMPVSDMMDEYLHGRLEGDQKELFENHLLECDKCYEMFKERKTIISGLRPVLDDLKEKKLN